MQLVTLFGRTSEATRKGKNRMADPHGEPTQQFQSETAQLFSPSVHGIATVLPFSYS